MLRGILRGELKTLRRAEWHRRRRKERSKKRANFLSNPFGFARTLLGEKRNGNLEASEEEINNHLRDTMSDSAKDQDMGINNRLIHQKPPVVQYDTRLPTWKEMQEVVRATRSASAPGPSGVPYIVYKRCKGVLQILWKILRVTMEKKKFMVPLSIKKVMQTVFLHINRPITAEFLEKGATVSSDSCCQFLR